MVDPALKGVLLEQNRVIETLVKSLIVKVKARRPGQDQPFSFDSSQEKLPEDIRSDYQRTRTGYTGEHSTSNVRGSNIQDPVSHRREPLNIDPEQMNLQREFSRNSAESTRDYETSDSPFLVGDTVHIHSGPHAGTTGIVHDYGAAKDSDLGEDWVEVLPHGTRYDYGGGYPSENLHPQGDYEVLDVHPDHVRKVPGTLNSEYQHSKDPDAGRNPNLPQGRIRKSLNGWEAFCARKGLCSSCGMGPCKCLKTKALEQDSSKGKKDVARLRNALSDLEEAHPESEEDIGDAKEEVGEGYGDEDKSTTWTKFGRDKFVFRTGRYTYVIYFNNKGGRGQTRKQEEASFEKQKTQEKEQTRKEESKGEIKKEGKSLDNIRVKEIEEEQENLKGLASYVKKSVEDLNRKRKRLEDESEKDTARSNKGLYQDDRNAAHQASLEAHQATETANASGEMNHAARDSAETALIHSEAGRHGDARNYHGYATSWHQGLINEMTPKEGWDQNSVDYVVPIIQHHRRAVQAHDLAGRIHHDVLEEHGAPEQEKALLFIVPSGINPASFKSFLSHQGDIKSCINCVQHHIMSSKALSPEERRRLEASYRNNERQHRRAIQEADEGGWYETPIGTPTPDKKHGAYRRESARDENEVRTDDLARRFEGLPEYEE